jgi:CRP-like cAMP-binding protein
MMNGAQNHILASLAATEAWPGLEPHLEVAELGKGEDLADWMEQRARVCFPCEGILSLVVPLTDGHLVQTGLVGRDGAIGALHALLGTVPLNRIEALVPVKALAIEAARLREIANLSPGVRSLLLAYERFSLAEMQQSAACNAVHGVSQRMCRWLLRMSDLIGTNIPITHEVLSEAMGVRRPSITVAAASLQGAGLIRYRHGHIQIANMEGLKRSSCECYAAVRDHYDRIVNNHS